MWIIFLLALTLPACTSTPAPADTASENPAETGKPFTLDQLVATDPSTVQLAAGKVQLIEFFAYW